MMNEDDYLQVNESTGDIAMRKSRWLGGWVANT